MRRDRRRPRTGAIVAALSVATLWAAACTHTPQRNEVFRLPAPYNFVFYEQHPEAARSFYAAHYAHFGIYEVLLRHGPEADDELEALRRRVIRYIEAPPRFEPPAEIIAPEWSKMAFETGRSMDWTHMLHSQLYDILADDRVPDRRSAGERAISYYLSNPHSAFSTRGYGHRWMEAGGAWAGAFRRAHPELNGILWAYHWHHAAVYEALMEEEPEARRRSLDRVIATFTDSVLADPPREMPLTAEVAPRFSALFPAAAHIFDNLHMMHDVVNDIMTDGSLSRAEQEAEIERMRWNMRYLAQDVVVAPGMPMGEDHDHAMTEAAQRVPTPLSDGRWLPQGHPEARLASMDELMAPLFPGQVPGARRPGHPEHEAPEREPHDHETHEPDTVERGNRLPSVGPARGRIR